MTSKPSRRSNWPDALGRVVAVLWLLGSRLAVLFVTLELYTWVRKTYFVRPASVAFAHAHQILDLERSLGLDIELSLQRRVLEHDWLVHFFTVYYQNMKTAFYISAALALVLAPATFRRRRRLFFLATAIALPWYALYPLAPPRLMGPEGYPFVDTDALLHHGGVIQAGTANPYAAMPSMHIGWSIIAALMLAAALPWHRLGAILGTLHVILMSLTVMATGNHYLLDIVGGGLVIALALALDRWLPAPLIAFGQRRGTSAGTSEQSAAPSVRTRHPVALVTGGGAPER